MSSVIFDEAKGHSDKHKVIAEELKNHLLTDKIMKVLEKDWGINN